MNPQKKKLLKELHTESTPEWKAALEKEWPWLAKPGLEVDKWYVPSLGGLQLVKEFKENGQISCGFSPAGNWVGIGLRQFRELRPATESEVSTALIKEAKKRGYNGNNAECLFDQTLKIEGDIRFKFVARINQLYVFGSSHGVSNCIFDNGTWAPITTRTITKAEAEKELKAKIV